MLTFASKKLSTGANGQKKDAASFCCHGPRSFDRAVMVRMARAAARQPGITAAQAVAIDTGAL